jgi:TolC family type I secretion outer membrane protein
MRRVFHRGTVSALALLAGLGMADPSFAQSLEDALVRTYQNNPTIAAQRARLRSTDEQVPRALANWRPNVSVQVDAGKGIEATELNGADRSTAIKNSENRFERLYSLTVTQPIFRGFRTTAETERAENRVMAERARLLGIEQTVFRDTIIAYLNVVRDEAVLDLNMNNERVLKKQLEATMDRFEVGEVTRTDVAQAEARYARATAERVQSEGQLEASRAAYLRLVGDPPGKLAEPPVPKELPNSLKEAVETARARNPAVVAADFDQKAAESDVDLVAGEGLPSVNLIGSFSKNDNASGVYSRSNEGRAIARLTVPLYQQGAVDARLRESKQVASQRKVQIEEARRQAVEDAIAAWEEMVSARARVTSFTKEAEANRIALEGVEQEAAAGLRTVLDVLDAEQELRDARVNLVRARRDHVVGAYRVRQAIGNLTARDMALPIEVYNVETYYNKVRDKIWGSGIDE